MPAGDPCATIGQCVVHAECSAPNGGLCECRKGYFQKQGKCVSRKPPGQGCESNEECVSDAECSPVTGLCTCGRGLFAAGSECKPLIDAGGWSVTVKNRVVLCRCHISIVTEEEKEAKYEKHSANEWEHR